MIKYDAWYLPDNETHLPWWMDQTNRVVEGRKTYQFHKYEAALARCAQRRVAVDVGSHVGLWAYWMAADFETLEAFEPHPDHQACWNINMIGRRGNARLHPYALGSRFGTVSLKTGPDSSGDTYVDVSKPYGDVVMRTLDSFALPIVDLLKIDCEGFEAFVLEGARETLERCAPVVIVEQKPTHGEKYGISDTAGVELLTTLGYVQRQNIVGDVILTKAGS